MKNNTCTARKGSACYQPERKVGVDTGNTLRKQRKKNAVMVIDSLTWEMQQGCVIRVSTEVR